MADFPTLKYFAYEHLPLKLQGMSMKFKELAEYVAEHTRDEREASVALRKLLEAKDAAVRSLI